MARAQRLEKERPYRIDPDDENYIKDKQRPAVIKEDLREMGSRKKVHELLESKSFCRQLETVMKLEQDCGIDSSGPYPLMGTPSRSRMRTLPIADLFKEEYDVDERKARIELACLLRLISHERWSNSIYAHVSVRLGDDYVTQPIGLFYHEMRASTLLRLNNREEIIDNGTTTLGINKNTFSIHSSIYKERQDVHCIIHLQSPIVTAVSSLKCGLLPICPEATYLGPVGYFDYFGSITDSDKDRWSQTIKSKNAIVLRNNGMITMGRTVQEATLYAHHIVTACDIQIRAAKGGLDNVYIPRTTILETEGATGDETVEINGNTVVNEELTIRNEERRSIDDVVGTLEWEAFMRLLDNEGLGTGHVYKQPYWNDINDDSLDENMMSSSMYKRAQSNRWLSSPNKYEKIEILEKGTDQPRRITKWVNDHFSPIQTGTPVKITSAHQFAPLSPNVKEFKKKQSSIKNLSALGVLNPGPHSHVLDGPTFTDLYQCGETSQIPENRSIIIGTASKGIIQRDYQNHAQVYRQLYAANPFTVKGDAELNEYLHKLEARRSEGNRSKSCDPISRSTLRRDSSQFIDSSTLSRRFLDQRGMTSSDDELNNIERIADAGTSSGVSQTMSVERLSLKQLKKKDKKKGGIINYLRNKIHHL